jgi:oligosaccharide translocation protein RFT1
MIFGEGATSLITPVITLSIAYLYGDLNPYFAHSCVLHGIAALIEGAAEPLAVQFVLSFNYAVPAQAETIAVFIKTLALYLLCITAEMQPLLAFGYSQIVFSSLYALIIYWHSSAKLIDAFCPTKISKGTYIQPEMKTMGGQFTLMALMKFMLQEMEKIVVVAFRKDDIKVSAEFSLVSHIGAFVPRFLYSPIEEVSYNLFSKLSSEVTHTKDDHEEEEGLIGKVEERKT